MSPSETKSFKSPFRRSWMSVFGKEEDFRSFGPFIVNARSVVLVRARPRLVKAVHPRVSKRPETTVLPLCGRSFKLLILLALQYSQDFSILEMILKYSSAKYSCSFQAAIIIPDSFKFLEKILDPIYFFQYIF